MLGGLHYFGLLRLSFEKNYDGVSFLLRKVLVSYDKFKIHTTFSFNNQKVLLKPTMSTKALGTFSGPS